MAFSRTLAYNCRELESELVPEWRAKYLDYSVNTIEPVVLLLIPNISLSSMGKGKLLLSRAHCGM
jgi:hypothetical protein